MKDKLVNLLRRLWCFLTGMWYCDYCKQWHYKGTEQYLFTITKEDVHIRSVELSKELTPWDKRRAYEMACCPVGRQALLDKDTAWLSKLLSGPLVIGNTIMFSYDTLMSFYLKNTAHAPRGEVGPVWEKLTHSQEFLFPDGSTIDEQLEYAAEVEEEPKDFEEEMLEELQSNAAAPGVIVECIGAGTDSGTVTTLEGCKHCTLNKYCAAPNKVEVKHTFNVFSGADVPATLLTVFVTSKLKQLPDAGSFQEAVASVCTNLSLAEDNKAAYIDPTALTVFGETVVWALEYSVAHSIANSWVGTWAPVWRMTTDDPNTAKLAWPEAEYNCKYCPLNPELCTIYMATRECSPGYCTLGRLTGKPCEEYYTFTDFLKYGC